MASFAPGGAGDSSLKICAASSLDACLVCRDLGRSIGVVAELVLLLVESRTKLTFGRINWDAVKMSSIERVLWSRNNVRASRDVLESRSMIARSVCTKVWKSRSAHGIQLVAGNRLTIRSCS